MTHRLFRNGDTIYGTDGQDDLAQSYIDLGYTEITGAEYDAILTPPPLDPVAEDVSAEALRRIDAIADARTRDQLMQRALRLTMKVAISGEALTAEEQAEIAAGSALTSQIEAVQAAEDVILALDPIPADFADDARWP